MTTTAPRTRRCQGCGYRFVADGDQWFCSARCEGGIALSQVLAGLQRLAQQHAVAFGGPVEARRRER